MKNLGTIVAAVFLGLVLLLYMCTFQVRFTEVAIRVTWGKPASMAITEPGMGFRWPYPVQSIVKYDKRIRILEDLTEETRTADGKNLLLTTYTLWRIADPSKFHMNFPHGVEDAKSKLQTTIGTHNSSVVGNTQFRDFVSTIPEERKIREIEQRIRDLVAHDAKKEYGIDIVGFGIKKLGLPTAVTTSIFESMKSHEQKKAVKYTAEGEAEASETIARAKSAEERIMAAARHKVAEIEASAERVVSEYYKEFDKLPELRIFLDKLRTVANALSSRTTIIFDTSQSPWDIFDADARKRIPQGGGRVDRSAVPGE
ncbi:MAG: hypothetical protein IIC51_01545 [Planctomycetes bacterium]|nr:hypothetical protein [Planctomycetota bacterium]